MKNSLSYCLFSLSSLSIRSEGYYV